MSKDFQTVVEANPVEADKRHLIGQLVAFNDAQAEPEGTSKVAVFTRSKDILVGGLLGFTHWNWLFVKQLWVGEAWRGQGIGSELMKQAETEAVQRSCLHAHLDTFDFQALPFYKKLGYEVFGELDDYPVGHRRYFLKKRNLG